MLSKQAKKAFSELELPYSAIAVKFCRNKPEGYNRAEDIDYINTISETRRSCYCVE